MKAIKTADIRQSFIDFFVQRGHSHQPSSPVIPLDDPTLLFTNAGMNQFKDVFTGRRKVSFKRAVSSQKCIRAGGKHNDLENVGETGRHHTFFEMLGNFSFGDYFKEDAIKFAWDWVTVTLGLPKDRLFATVYTEDDDAFELWEKIAPELKGERVLRFGKKDNYWSMGEVGPCGPCSEIHLDRGEHLSKNDPDAWINTESERFVEIWNLVFMQYDQMPDGTVVPLPKPSVDTGAGLERIAAAMQGADSNYETDLFQPLTAHVADITGVKYTPDGNGTSHRVIADHVRALAFALADGGGLSNEGRGYVLRRILRRAARHGRLLNYHKPIIYRLVPTLVDIMGGYFTELKEKQKHIEAVIKTEEERFGELLDTGLELFADLEKKVKASGSDTIPGEEIFKLYDTYGFPVDMTAIMAREAGLKMDMEGFETHMSARQEQSRAGADFFIKEDKQLGEFGRFVERLSDMIITLHNKEKTVFPSQYIHELQREFNYPITATLFMIGKTGLRPDIENYVKMQTNQGMGNETKDIPDDLKIQLDGIIETANRFGWRRPALDFIRGDKEPVFEVTATVLGGIQAGSPDKVAVFLDRTPFYVEAGGQVSDQGKITANSLQLHVEKAVEYRGYIFHVGKLVGGKLEDLISAPEVIARIDEKRRWDIMRNHTATHLLHAALREVIGEHVKQSGSMVDSDRLRFDFAHFQALTTDEIAKIEKIVNDKLLVGLPVKTKVMKVDEALNVPGIMALFDEKYGDEVRVVYVGEGDDLQTGENIYSRELCGGTHVTNTAQIGSFLITDESAIASGVRRIEAVSGRVASELSRSNKQTVQQVGGLLNVPGEEVIDAVKRVTAAVSDLQKENKKLRAERFSGGGGSVGKKEKIGAVEFVHHDFGETDPESASGWADSFKSAKKSTIALAVGMINGKRTFMATASKAAVDSGIDTGKLFGELIRELGGQGGGKANFARGGLPDEVAYDDLIAQAKAKIKKIQS